jgi:hypothetical protein
MPQPTAYGHNYRRARAVLLAQQLPCQLRLACDGAIADSADHVPPLALHVHVPGSGCCRLLPECLACQRSQGGSVANLLRARARTPAIPRPSRVWWGE